MSLLLLLCCALCSTLSQLCQKQASTLPGDHRRQLIFWLVLAACALVVAFLLWLRVLQHLPLTLAYPMLSLSFVLVTLSARCLWQEPVTSRQWWGVVAIVLGISLLGATL